MTNQIRVGLAICFCRCRFVSVTPSGPARIVASSLAILVVAACVGLLGGRHLFAQTSYAGQSTSVGPPQSAKKLSASAIQIEPVEYADVKLPPEFRMAVYENLVQEVTKSGTFQRVFRSGDRSAVDVPDLVVLRMKVRGFRQGSERTREVTTVAGATSVDLGVQVTGRNGNVLVDRDVEGKVRFFGGNLRATYDFSKKVTKILRQSFYNRRSPARFCRRRFVDTRTCKSSQQAGCPQNRSDSQDQ
jgi:hypothetical protein